MDVPIELYNIEIQNGFKGYKRKSSTFSPKTDVVGFSAYFIFHGAWVTFDNSIS